MTAPDFFEKQKRLNQIEEDISYQDWLQNRIEKNQPVEGDLIEAYKNNEFSILIIRNFQDYRNMKTIFPTKRESDSEKKEDKSTEIKVRFIKEKQ